MDEDQHYERFDMDNDYEGGEWIGGEFFHQGQRKRKMQTREEQLYGSFLENSGAVENSSLYCTSAALIVRGYGC